MARKLNKEDLARAKVFFPELLGGGNTAKDKQEAQDDVAAARAEYGDDFDIKALMASAKDPITNTLRNLKIDDRDLPYAKNFYDWCFNVSGLESKPWARQMWVSLHLCGDICPRCSRKSWVQDVMKVPKKLPTEALAEELTFLEYGVCPKCKARKSELVRSGEMKFFDEMILVWGQRSGKSRTAAAIAGYHTHRFLRFPKFSTLTTSMDSVTPLTFSFVSLSFSKAFALLWKPFQENIAQSTWYQDYFKMLDHYGEKYGEELYFRRKEYLTFAHKNLILKPTHPAWDQLRGETRFGGAIDELGLFEPPANLASIIAKGARGNTEDDEPDDDIEEDSGENESKRANADEAHRSIETSLGTVRVAAQELLMERGIDSVPTGILMGVSSPTAWHDKVMRLLAESKTEIGSQHMISSQLPTWEVNPSFSEDSSIIKSAFARNREKADRDWGANPPRVHSSFIKEATIKNKVFVGRRNSHQVEYDYTDGEISGKLKRVHQHCPFPTLMTMDAGEVNNSFVIDVMYYDFDTGKTVTSTIVELIPTGRRRINFVKVYEQIIRPLAKDLHTQILLADRWNSTSILQQFVRDFPGAKAKQFSPKRKHFDQAVQLLMDGNAVLPATEMPLDDILGQYVENYRRHFLGSPVSHLAHQMSTVKETSPARPPTKGDGFTDDSFRAWVLGASLMQDEKVLQILNDARTKMGPRVAAPVATYVSRSGIGRFPGLS